MDGNIYNTIEWASKVSMEGEVPFAEIVRTLLAAGVESYYADYRANRKTYYLPNGEAVTMELPAPLVRIAHAFDDAAVHAAVVGAQKGEVKYPYFLELTRFAGCVGYIVWLSGGHVTYFGRNGET
ncbi:MAG: DUF1398 family protein, partial [Pseudomonadota bacterium]|nr:DUF1398 family protein [Pseudomonadota bacterium]